MPVKIFLGSTQYNCRRRSVRLPGFVLGGRELVVLVLLLMCVSACVPTVYLMPTPVAISEGRLDPFLVNPKLEQSNRITVLYATNRLPLGLRYARSYSTFFDQDLRLGIAQLRIGESEKDWDTLYQLSTTSADSKRPALFLENVHEQAMVSEDQDLQQLTPREREYFGSINAALAASLDKSLTVYVHGANSNFYRSSAQAAQYRHFTGSNSVVLVYVWLSAESLIRYGTDVDNVRQSVAVFARLLRLMAAHTDARHINILAYSAGAQIVSPALAQLRQSFSEQSNSDVRAKLRLGKVYFAAPDLDFREFVQQLPVYLDITRSVTVSVNLNDTVLALSERHHGVSRAGRANLSELSAEQSLWLLETFQRTNFTLIEIESAEIPGMSKGAHDFWYNHAWVSTDVLAYFLLDANPAARGLQEKHSIHGAVYWVFPNDYPEQSQRAIARLVETLGPRIAPRLPAAAGADN